MAAAGGSNNNNSTVQSIPLLTSTKLRELLMTLTGPREKLDDVVELALVRIADDLAMEVSAAAAQLASFRRSNVVEARDVLYGAEHQFGMTGITGEVEAVMRKAIVGGESVSDSEGVSPPKRGRKASSVPRGGGRRASGR